MTSSPGRDTDISFVAERSLRREQLIAAASGILWEWHTNLRLVGGLGASESSMADTRIALIVHAGDEVDFDWARARAAIANGCVVVCETSKGFEPLVPGMHFVMAPYENVVEQAVALAFDEPRRGAIAGAARMLTLPLPPSRRPAIETPTGNKQLRRRSPSPGTPNHTLQQLVTELKVAILAQRELSRSIEATISTVEHDDANYADVTSTSAWSSFNAEVSVIVPLFDEAHRLRATIDSVIAASAGSDLRVELLIVDDHSTDDSREVVEELLTEIDWFPATLLARAANGGPAVARNAGFSAARAPHVLAVDAGSMLYPTGLRRLLDSLLVAPDDVVATYGLVERFDTTGPLGLAGHQPWDIDLLVHGEFSAALAMFKRAAWSQLGGYTTPTGGVEDGWADYDLWLSAAESGLRAELVGSVIGRHREPLASMLNVAEIDTATTFITLRERHPRLPWPS